jgi:sugar phosphate isomerase/epimerase
MKLGISTYTYAWAIGFPGAAPNRPLRPMELLDKAVELGVSLVQFGMNMPLARLPEKDLREVVKRADSWKIDLESATQGLSPAHLRRQIQFAKQNGLILLKTTPENSDGKLPLRTELAGNLRAIAQDLAANEMHLAIDDSHIPAQDLNELLTPIGSPWLGVALDTLNPIAIPQGWQIAVRVLAHRTLSVQLKDFLVQPAWHGMGLTVEGRPIGKGQLNIPWIVDSFAALRVTPSVIVESWTPQQKTLQETISLEDAWAKQSVDYLRHYIFD